MKDDLAGMKLLLASPTYGPVDPLCARDLRIAIMATAGRGVEWYGDASPDRMGFATARNTVAQNALEDPDINGIVWVDSDIRQGPTDLVRLLDSANHFKADFVTGVYHQRLFPHHPVFYLWSDEKNGYIACEEYERDKFAPIDACGFGFVYTSKKAIERVAGLKEFNPEKGWFPDERDTGGYGEDISFCSLAAKAKVQLFINTGVIVGHLGDPKVVYDKDQVKLQKGERPPTRGKWGSK